jgi:hypothetical protein
MGVCTMGIPTSRSRFPSLAKGGPASERCFGRQGPEVQILSLRPALSANPQDTRRDQPLVFDVVSHDDIEAANAMLANPNIGVTQIAHRLGVSPADALSLYPRCAICEHAYL